MTTLPLPPSIQALSRKVLLLEGQRNGLLAQEESLKWEIARGEEEERVLAFTSELFRYLIQEQVSEGQEKTQRLLTEGLKEIFFDQDLSVEARMEESRGKISVDLVTVHKKESSRIEGSVLDAFGGSIATVESILLRILLLFRRGLRPVLVLDETLPAVSNIYVDRAARFLSSLCEKMGLDILLISHDQSLVSAATHAYETHVVSGHTTYRKVL